MGEGLVSDRRKRKLQCISHMDKANEDEQTHRR